MARKQIIAALCLAVTATFTLPPAGAQQTGRFLVAANQTVAIRAGRVFDARTGTLLNNQIIIVRGDRIADVGPNAAIPAGARVIDLSAATVLPGMVDAHVHVNTGGETP